MALAAVCCLPLSAQDMKIKGIGHNNRYDDGDQMKSKYIGSLVDDNGKYITDENGNVRTVFIVDQSIYSMEWDGLSLTTPVKDPAVRLSDFYSAGTITDLDKAIWASNFNLLYGNSGALYIDGKLVTVMSRDEQSTTDDVLFTVRKWDAKTGDLLSSEHFPKSACIESAGMSYNPKDGKVYGLFYLTEQQLPDDITSDPEYFVDDDGESSSTDAGYCLCTIDLQTMKLTPITKGLYYYNFITFAINSEGRAFALSSGGSSGYQDENGKIRNIDNKLGGAQLYEFNLETGNIYMKAVEKTDSTGEAYTEYETLTDGTGYCSQYCRQSACFAKSNPNKMYWNGYYNSGKGYNDWGSWSSLSDKEWRTNGKFDTCLYEVDINTGEAVRLAKIPNRWTFSALWVDGDDNSDGAGIEISGIETARTAQAATGTQVYNAQGQLVGTSMPQARGLYILRQGDKVRKVMTR